MVSRSSDSFPRISQAHARGLPMFRTAELQRKLPKKDYYQLSFTVVFARVDGAGKSETVNRLYARLGRVRTGVQRPGGAHQHPPGAVNAGRSDR